MRAAHWSREQVVDHFKNRDRQLAVAISVSFPLSMALHLADVIPIWAIPLGTLPASLPFAFEHLYLFGTVRKVDPSRFTPTNRGSS